jgi:hypothetical protein
MVRTDGCMYRAESRSDSSILSVNYSLTKAARLVPTAYDGLLFCGDFNYSQISWSADGVTQTDSAENSLAQSFAQAFEDSHLCQSVIQPTFQLEEGSSTNVLDLVLTESKNRVYDIVYDSPLTSTKKALLVLTLKYYLKDKFNNNHSGKCFNYSA